MIWHEKNSWKFSYPAQETASDKVCRWDCDTVGSVLLDFQADEGKQDETSTGSWKERSCFIESWLLNIESMAWFKGKSPVNPLFEWFLHMCTIRYLGFSRFQFPVSTDPMIESARDTEGMSWRATVTGWTLWPWTRTMWFVRGPTLMSPRSLKTWRRRRCHKCRLGFMGYL